jgi:DNA polymerase-1
MKGAPLTAQGKGTNFLKYALWYAQLGFRVIPLKERSKEPLIADWPNKATTDEATIREWWDTWPKANIGIATGRYRDGYFCVLDFDPRNGGGWYGEAGPETLPPTWVVQTGGGGRHYYYKAPSPLRCRKLSEGVDLKGEGGYVVAPPSIHPEGGEYVWEVGSGPSECPLAPLSKWAEVVAVPDESAVQDESKYYTMEPPIPEGYRFYFTASLMGLLVGKGADIEKVTEFILANQGWLFEHGKSPFTEREIKAVGRWLSKKAPGRPVSRWRTALEKAGVAKQVIEAWVSYIGEPEPAPNPKQAKGGSGKREIIAELLEAAEWVRFRGDLWLTHKGQLYALSEAHEYVFAVSKEIVSQQTAKEVAMAMRRAKAPTAIPIDRAVVLYDEAPRYGRAAGYEGVWLAPVDEIWVVTEKGVYKWPLDAPPPGVYYRPDRVLPRKPIMGREGLNELRIYWARATKNLDEGEKGPELSLAFLAPVLLGISRLGVFFTGEKGSGKSTAAKAFLHIVYGRPPISGMGDTNRDRLSAAAEDRIFYADDIDITDAEMQKLMRVGLTGGQVRVRKLYEDKKNEVMAIDGSYFLCGIEAKGLRADTLERFISLRFSPKVRNPESQVENYFAENWHIALGGLLTLYQSAAALPEPDLSAWGWVRMQDSLIWAFRFAEVLKAKEELQTWVLEVRGAAMMQAKFGELAEAIIKGRIKEGAVYTARTLAEILWPDLAMGGTNGMDGGKNALYRKKHAISSPAGRKALADIALSCGLRVRMQKVAGEGGKPRWEYVFEPATFEQGWDVPENTLAALCEVPHGHPEGVWDSPAEPIPQNGHAPVPEVHGEGEAPQIAPEPAPVAAKGSPAEVGLELPLYIEETAKAGRRLLELYTQLTQRNGASADTLEWGMRTLQALVYGYWAALSEGEPLRVGDREYASPTPKEGLAVVQRAVRELERALNGEEVALEPLPEVPDLPVPDPTPGEGEPKWELVSDASRLPDLEERLQREDAVGWDLETVAHPGTLGGALHPATGRARLFTLYLPTENTAYLIDLDRVPEAWGLLAKVKKIVGHNLTFDLSFAAAKGAYIANPKERLWDTMIAEKLLDCKEYSEPRRHSLKELAAKVGIRLNKEHQTANWGGPLTGDMLRYAAMDAYAAYRVYLSQRERIAWAGLGRAMAIEMGALPAIAAMRAWGVGVDGEALEKAWKASRAEMERLEKELEPYGREVEPSLNLGERLNWNRLELIKKVLRRQGLPVGETNEEALAPHKKHPFVATLLKWREAKKRKELLAELLTPLKADGRIYPDWEPLGAGTGRMACSSPNLQQTPHELRAYIKPRAGCVLIKADFSQIELRIAAALAKDRRMLKAFEAGTDLHRLTASLILSKPLDQVGKEERQLAKALNFGLLYGMGAGRLKNYAESEYGVSLPLERAKEYREKFFATYPDLAKWHRETTRKLKEAESRGEGGIVVETLAGRKRWVETRTAALNTPVQGTGADGLKAAVAVLYKRLLERGLWGEVRIVLLVHDEIVVEAPEPLAIVATHLLTEAMREGMAAIVKGVPIEVEAGIYADWGQTLHPLQEAWEHFAKLPEGLPVREAILKGEDFDPMAAGDFLIDAWIVKAALCGGDIELPF